MKQCKTVKTWTRTGVQNLVRHRWGRYYARIFTGGKETWKALKTDVMEVAKQKLPAVIKEAGSAPRAQKNAECGRMTIKDCTVVFEERLAQGFGLRGRGKMVRRIRPSSILYRQKTLKALFKTWPELSERDVRRVSAREVEDWAEKFSADYSSTVYNNTLTLSGLSFELRLMQGQCRRTRLNRLGA